MKEVGGVMGSHAFKEGSVDGNFFNLLYFYIDTQSQLLELFDQKLTVDQVDGWCALPRGLSAGILCKRARCDE